MRFEYVPDNYTKLASWEFKEIHFAPSSLVLGRSFVDDHIIGYELAGPYRDALIR